MTRHVYILKLEKDCYYIGCAADVSSRYAQHCRGEGAAWTKRHKPIRIEAQHSGGFEEENMWTKRYMAKYGIECVRGGAYTRLNLSHAERAVLRKELRSLENACFQCGSKDHYVRQCPQRQIVPCARCGTTCHNTVSCDARYCYRCGRSGHAVENCYARTHRHPSASMSCCYRCGRSDHWRVTCTAKTDRFGVPLRRHHVLDKLGALFHMVRKTVS